MDCSKSISKEHFLSKSVLLLLDEKQIKVRGAPWHTAGEVRGYSIAALASNILCKRHNSALSPLDDAAKRFFEALREIFDDIADTRTLSLKPKWFLFSGQELELWLVKTAFGLYEAGVLSRSGARLRDRQLLNSDLLGSLSGKPIIAPCGLYVMSSGGKHFGMRNALDINVLFSNDDQHMTGITIAFMGLTLAIALDPRASYKQWASAYKFRPGFIQFRNKRRMHSIVLTWPGGTGPGQQAVLFEKTHPNRELSASVPNLP